MGVPLEQLFGAHIVDAIGEHVFEVIRPYLDRVLHGERVEHASDIPFAHGTRSIHAINTPDVNSEGQITGWFVSITDVTEQRFLEREVLRICEVERLRVGAELYDGIFQEMVAAGFMAKGLQRVLEKAKNRLASDLRVLTDAISQTAAHTRQIAHGMNPIFAKGDGLMDALRELAIGTAERHPLQCELECSSPVAVFDPVVNTQLFLIAQEAVHNAVKHSQASRVELVLRESETEILLGVTDNGCGLPAGADSSPGFGLRSMRYRAGLIRAILRIRNREGGGAEIICRVPKQQEVSQGTCS